MSVDSFMICFRQLYFLTQTDEFAKAIAFSWRPFLPIFGRIFRILGGGGHGDLR